MSARSLLSRLTWISIGLLGVIFFTHPVRGEDIYQLDQQLQNTQLQLNSALNQKNTTQTELQRLEQLKRSYSGTLGNLQNNYQLTKEQLSVTETELANRLTELAQIETDLQQTKEALLKRQLNLKSTVRAQYISENPSWITSFLLQNQQRLFTQIFVYRESVIADNKTQAKTLSQEISQIKEIEALLTQIKTELEEQQQSLAQQQRTLQNQIGQTQQQITAAESQLVNLQQSLVGLDQTISSLTQKQREILSAKAAAALASTSIGNVETNPTAIAKSPPQDGQVYFSFWTYGYPHRVGMNQYGALGRAQAGQTVTEILATYYQNTQLTTQTGLSQITIQTNQGLQTIPFEEDYLLGIGEMPSCWGEPSRGGLEALKAQAIAARTYALAYTQNGTQPICTTQSCQVYIGASKVSGTCGQYWKQAVESTRGQILTYQGQPITAWYASTAGGFTLSSAEVWGSTRAYAQGISDSDVSGKAFDGPQHADSPWYHKAWGDEPWLSISQVTDIINAALLPTSLDNYLAPKEKGGYSSGEVTAKLSELSIQPVQQLKSIEVIDQNGRSGASTAQVKELRVYFGSGQTVTIPASRFKLVYNLRSPGTNAIWTSRFDILSAAEM